jgi:hypothetical protein
MVYLQLSQAYRDFDKVKINDISFVAQAERTQSSITFTYQIYKVTGSQTSVLTTQTVNLFNLTDVNSVAATAPATGFNMYDAVCKILLEYLVSKKIESGTIEVA